MAMDSYFDLDREALAASIAGTDHLLFRFATVSPRVFVDFRSEGEVGPVVHVLPPAGSLVERLVSIREARPELPLPDRLMLIAAPARVRGLERMGALDAIRDRLAGLDACDQRIELDLACEPLQALEREEMRRAITGEGYRTVWTSAPER